MYKYFFLTLVLEALPAPEVLPDLRDVRPLGDGRREDLAEEREGDGVEALEERPRVVLVAPLLVHRVLGRRVVPRQFCKGGGGDSIRLASGFGNCDSAARII